MKKHLTLALLLAAAPFAASAGELNYSYIEGGYAHVDIDNADEGDGFQVRGSAQLAESVYLFGGVGSVGLDNVDADFSEIQAGLGFRSAVSDRADFIAEGSYVRQEVELNGGSLFGSQSVTASGGRVSAGIRGLLADNFEGWVKGSYTDGGDFEGDFSGLVGAQLKFNPTWGLVGEFEAGGDISKFMVGVRASF